jgi:AcrR family transcriptional regulator
MEPNEAPNIQPRAKPFAEAVPAGVENIKARKQQVVRNALSSAAEKLFLARGFENVTVEEIALSAGVSRRTFFRYYESKEDVLVERFSLLGEVLLSKLAARPLDEPALLAIRNALVPTMEASLAEPEIIRDTVRLLRETSALRRALLERRSRLEERIARLMIERIGSNPQDNTAMLLAFVTRALMDTVFNAWYDHETNDIAGLVDELIGRLCGVVMALPVEFRGAEH